MDIVSRIQVCNIVINNLNILIYSCTKIAIQLYPASSEFLEDNRKRALIYHSDKCELLVMAEEGKITLPWCKFCQSALVAKIKVDNSVTESHGLGETKLAGDSVINLERPVETSHFEVGPKEVKDERVEFDNDGDSTYEDEGAVDNRNTDSLTEGMRLRRLALWKYFTEKDNDIATCNTCDKVLRAHKHGSTANLVRDDSQCCEILQIMQ